jgi:hypothetical protein
MVACALHGWTSTGSAVERPVGRRLNLRRNLVRRRLAANTSAVCARSWRLVVIESSLIDAVDGIVDAILNVLKSLIATPGMARAGIGTEGHGSLTPGAPATRNADMDFWPWRIATDAAATAASKALPWFRTRASSSVVEHRPASRQNDHVLGQSIVASLLFESKRGSLPVPCAIRRPRCANL